MGRGREEQWHRPGASRGDVPRGDVHGAFKRLDVGEVLNLLDDHLLWRRRRGQSGSRYGVPGCRARGLEGRLPGLVAPFPLGHDRLEIKMRPSGTGSFACTT